VRSHGKNFYIASFLLPAEARRAVYAIYAFARHVDDLVDEVPADMPAAAIHQALDSAESNLRSTYIGQPPPGFWPALAETVSRHGLSLVYFHDLIEGMRHDIAGGEFENFAALSQYFYQVAATVGFLVAQVLDYDLPAVDPHIRSLGAAFQLTNVLRDVGEDYRRGRVYLPADERDRFGVARRDFGQPVASANVRRLVAFQVTRARELFAEGERYVPHPRKGVAAIRAGSAIYRAHLDELERQDYDPLRRRPSLSMRRRLWAAGSTWVLTSPALRRGEGNVCGAGFAGRIR
jgi:phytoene synthase